MENIIEVDRLTKNYGPHRAVDSLSFSVQKGEVVGFLGPNGAGKTTTMKIITGFMAASSGTVRVGGYDVFEDPMEVKKRIGYLPETPPVYGEMSVENYLKFVARLKGVEKSRLKSLVDRAIEKTDLGSVRKRLIQNLSKGYRQRVGISQALVSDPEVLILDEPTVGLDPRQVAEVRSLIKELAGQHTIILSTHILPEVQASCQRIVIINKGQIVMQDTIDRLSSRMGSSGRVHLRVNKPVESLVNTLQSSPGVLSLRQPFGHDSFEIDTDGSKETAAQLAAKVVASGAGLYEMRQETFNLEDVFLKLTSAEETQNSGAGAKT
jgi:ABC-2 type transport system ATP-binding protein